jgi:hypothetical protein
MALGGAKDSAPLTRVLEIGYTNTRNYDKK